MSKILILLILFGSSHSYSDVDEINSMGTTWRAGYNKYFKEMKPQVIKGLMGVLPEYLYQPVHPALPTATS